jgi:hypothetical protein
VLSDEAQVFATRLHFGCFGLKLMAGQVEIELLAAELESVACTVSVVVAVYVQHVGINESGVVGLPLNTIACHECFVGHAQVCGIEIHGCLDGGHG